MHGTHLLRGLGGPWCLLPAVVGLLSLASCQSDSEHRRVFVERYYADDFSLFREARIFVRGKDQHNNRLLVVMCQGATAPAHSAELLALVSVLPTTDSITRIKYVGKISQCAQLPDSIALAKVVRRFLHYQVAALGADAKGNVSVGFRGDEFGSADLLRVQDSTQLKPYFWREYVKVRGPWYARKAAD